MYAKIKNFALIKIFSIDKEKIKCYYIKRGDYMARRSKSIYRDKIDPADWAMRLSREQIDREESKFHSTNERREKTIRERSDLVKDLQQKHQNKKDSALATTEQYKAELESFLPELKAKMLASFNEIGINKTLKLYLNELKSVHEKSDVLSQLNKDILHKSVYNYMDRFLYDLAVEYPLFIKYLPEPVLTRNLTKILPFNKLELEDLQEIDSNLKNSPVFENDVFKNRYLKFFPNHINEMEDFEDITHALTLDASALRLLSVDSPKRRIMSTNSNVLASIVYHAPKTLDYLTKQEIDILAKQHASKLGKAIVAYPEGLNNPAFTRDFFIKNPPKYLFAIITKKQSFNSLQPYVDNFDGLREYYGLTANSPFSK